ncbi:hypothetical protein ALP72_02254 [Pseudomonas coronafaciens pv. coronafaciens]|uniref:hypothetical protein n=1 Tax=Pseudomonas coronafaciens TaxID=53409 RepID=UPI000EFDB3EE|nr:hypothetical protein [Pseudomonas coronafaciens]RMS11874.1 hypothetical protein ALP72_02254 [Pseudomonas coronafaciens pv. coronafaciens]
MIFSSTIKTINGEPSALTKSGLIIDCEPVSHPFIIGSDSEYILNKARSWLESYDNKGFNNHLNINCFYLFSVVYEESPTEHFYLLSFEGRNNPEKCVVMQAVYDEANSDFEVDYFALVARMSFTERAVANVEFNIAVRAFFFAKTEIALTSFFEFTQHPDFEESVATYTLLNY